MIPQPGRPFRNAMSVIVNKSCSLPEQEIQMVFVKATGPGGQNVNKVNTAVQLRFDIGKSVVLREDVKKRLIQISGSRVTENQVLLIEAKKFRTQEKNRQDALERLRVLVRKALIPPKPRKPTKPSRAAQQRRRQDKHHRSQTKKMRNFDPGSEI